MCLHKTDINPFFKSRAICKFNEVHVNKSNKGAPFYSSSANFNIRDRDISTGKDRSVPLLLIRMIVCWASVTYFQFHSRQFVRRLAEEILSYSSAVMLVALALSYLTVTCHIAYKTLSHVYFNILGGVKLSNVVSTTRCIYTCPVSPGMQPRPHLLKGFEWSDLYPSRKHFGGHLHPVFLGSDSYLIRKNTWSDQI